jgi:hypothetical protein
VSGGVCRLGGTPHPEPATRNHAGMGLSYLPLGSFGAKDVVVICLSAPPDVVAERVADLGLSQNGCS